MVHSARPSAAGDSRQVRRGLSAGRQLYGELGVPSDSYAERIGVLRTPGRCRSASVLADLYLVLACDLGRAEAWSAVDELVVPRVALALKAKVPRWPSRRSPEQVARDVPGFLILVASRSGRSTFASYRGESRLSCWMAGVAVNELRQIQRAEQRQQAALDRAIATPEYAAARSTHDPRVGDAASRLKAVVRETFARIPAHHRSALLLRIGSDATIAERAEQMGVKPPALSRSLALARERLCEEGVFAGSASRGDVDQLCAWSVTRKT